MMRVLYANFSKKIIMLLDLYGELKINWQQYLALKKYQLPCLQYPEKSKYNWNVNANKPTQASIKSG